LMTALAMSNARSQTIDLRPPDRLTLSAQGSTLTDTDGGYGGSLNWTHYFTPNAIFGIGGEHQEIAESQFSFGSLRASWGHGQPSSRFTIYGEGQYGNGDDDGRDFDYEVGALGISQSFTSKFSVQLESRYIDIDTTRGNLPKIGFTYLWTPRLVTTLAYANSVSGNVNTELFTGRLDHYGQHVNFIIGGASGQADPAVINQPGLDLPAQTLKQGFIGIGKTFTRGEIQLIGDYLQLAEIEKVTVSLTFTAYIGGGKAP
jgi:hypothetical protein